MSYRNTLFLIFSIVVFVLTGCIPYLSVLEDNNPIPTGTIVSTSTFSPTITPTSTITPEPTMTYMPALPPAEAIEKAIDLLQTNGGCELPCFWGFTPGVTSREEVVSKLYEFDNIGGVLGVDIPYGDLTVTIDVGPSLTENPNGSFRHLSVVYYVYEESARYTYKEDPFYMDGYYPSLPAILSIYGLPQGVYLFIDLGAAQGLEDIFLLFLDYSDYGWRVIYQMPAICSENECYGCPVNASVIIDTWEPGDLKMAGEYGFADGTGITIPLEEATNWNLSNFYESYSNSSYDSCIITYKDVFYY